MHIKYIANGDKTDSISGCGLKWEHGLVRDVSPELGEKLLAFPDTWERVADTKNTTTKHTHTIGLHHAEKPKEEPLPVVDFHAMDKAALLDFVETNYGEKLDKRQTEDTLRHKAIAIVSRHEMDKESEAK